MFLLRNQTSFYRSGLYLSEIWDKVKSTSWQVDIQQNCILFLLNEHSDTCFSLVPVDNFENRMQFFFNPVFTIRCSEQEERIVVRLRGRPEIPRLLLCLSVIFFSLLIGLITLMATVIIILAALLNSFLWMLLISVVVLIMYTLMKIIDDSIQSFRNYRHCYRALRTKIMEELELHPARRQAKILNA